MAARPLLPEVTEEWLQAVEQKIVSAQQFFAADAAGAMVASNANAGLKCVVSPAGAVVEPEGTMVSTSDDAVAREVLAVRDE